MGWQTSVIFIEMETPEDLPGLLDDLGVMEGAEAGEDVDFYSASTSMDFQEVYVCAAKGWTIVCGMPVMLAGAFQEYSRKANVVEMNLSGASSTYHYAVYTNGEERRAFTEQEGKVLHSRGAALPGEADLEDTYTEARVLEIVQRCTLPISDYEGLPFRSLTGQPN